MLLKLASLIVAAFGILGLTFSESTDSLPLVDCQTSKGPLRIEVHRDWAPLGADRFIELVQDNFFTDIAFFRCVNRFLTQFGISDNPTKKHWHNKNIKDDPNLNLGIHKNYVSFAGGGPNTRSTQLFIAFEYLDFLGKEPWETPFGVVIDGQSTLDHLYKGYGDIPPFGNGPDQQEIHIQGNKYVRSQFPLADFIHSCELVIPEEKEVAQEEEVHEVEAVKELQTNRLRTEMPLAVAIIDSNSKSDGGESDVNSRAEKGKESGIADETLIYRAVGFLCLVLVALFVYLRYMKPTVQATGKGQ